MPTRQVGGPRRKRRLMASIALIDHRIDQPPALGWVKPEQVIGDGREGEAGAVEDDGGPLGRLAQVFGQDRGREGDEGDAEQEEGVDDDEALVGPGDEAEDVVVVDPHDADSEEGDDVAEV